MRKKIVLLVQVCLTLTVVSCEDVNPKGNVNESEISFDDLKFWSNDPRVRKSEAAHSGKYVAFVDSTLPFSVGMICTLDDLSKEKFKSIEVSGFVYQKDKSASGGWVIELNNAYGGQLAWFIAEKDSFLTTTNEWKPFKVKLDLNNADLAKEDNLLKSYGWSRKGEILFDDVKYKWE